MDRKYFIYSLINIFLIVIWNYFSRQFYADYLFIQWSMNTFLIFIAIVILCIILPSINLTDLNVKNFNQIWWGRILIITLIAGIISFLIVWRRHCSLNFIESILNTAVVGILVGYGLTRWEEARTVNDEARRSIDALLVEIGQNRFLCQATIAGHPPVFFQTIVWDTFRVSRHFHRIWRNQQLVNNLHNLYLLITAANWRNNLLNVATNNIIFNPGNIAQNSVNTIQEILQDFLKNELLGQLQNMENEFGAFRNNFRVQI
jgi:hypothetical protein